MRQKPLVAIKIGGSILDDAARLQAMCHDIEIIHRDYAIVLIHGGSTTIQKEFAIHKTGGEFKDGLRITSAAAMDVVEMALCGIVNTRLVRALNAANIPALGMSGASAKLLCAEQYSIEHKQTGKVAMVHNQVVRYLLDGGYIPVIAPVGINNNGDSMNINADWAASAVAASLAVDTCIYISDQDGILEKNGQTVENLSRSKLLKLIEGSIVTEGMLAKAQSIIHALDAGIASVYVANGKRNAILLHIMDKRENDDEQKSIAHAERRYTTHIKGDV